MVGWFVLVSFGCQLSYKGVSQHGKHLERTPPDTLGLGYLLLWSGTRRRPVRIIE